MHKRLSYKLLIIALIVVSAVVRVSRFIPNVSPITAIALFAGATLTAPLSLLVPLLAMVASDVFIGFYSFPIMVSVYGSFVFVVWLGTWLKSERTPWRIIGATFAASTLFYLVTNAAVWKFSGMYPPTLDGLILSYYYAIPFYRNTLLGDVVYTYSLFLTVQYVPIFFSRLVSIAAAKVFHEKTP